MIANAKPADEFCAAFGHCFKVVADPEVMACVECGHRQLSPLGQEIEDVATYVAARSEEPPDSVRWATIYLSAKAGARYALLKRDGK